MINVVGVQVPQELQTKLGDAANQISKILGDTGCDMSVCLNILAVCATSGITSSVVPHDHQYFIDCFKSMIDGHYKAIQQGYHSIKNPKQEIH